MAVLGEAIDEGDDAGGPGEDGAPLLEGEVRRDDRRDALVAATDDVVEDVGGAAVARQIAQLVDLCGAAHKSTHVKHLVMWSRERSLVDEGTNSST